MFPYAFLIFTFVTVTLGSGDKRRTDCQLGALYWCSSLSNAVDCNAVEHCSALWTNLLERAAYHRTTDALETPYCKFCKGLTSTFYKLVTSNKAQKDLTARFLNLCTGMNSQERSNQLCKVTGKCLPDLMAIFSENVKDPFSNYCSNSHICNKVTENEFLSDKPESQSGNKPSESPETLLECKEALTTLINTITHTKFQLSLNHFVKVQSCGHLVSAYDLVNCYQKVELSLLLFVKRMKNLDQQNICKKISNCTGVLIKVNELIDVLHDYFERVKRFYEMVLKFEF